MLGGLGLALLAALAALSAGLYRRSLADRNTGPVARGRLVAERAGCYNCHGPGGVQGIPNPGSAGGPVPSWSGGTWMMYAQTPAEVEEWILDGIPERLRASLSHQTEVATRVIPMPAYRGRLSARELADLLAYWKAVSSYPADPPLAPAAARGRDLALATGCFGCHGPDGRGAAPNPGSFAGIIPPWDGPDFGELVRDETELREWILTGTAQRLGQHPIAGRFLSRQIIRMPAYNGHLTPTEVDDLVAYIEALRGAGN